MSLRNTRDNPNVYYVIYEQPQWSSLRECSGVILIKVFLYCRGSHTFCLAAKKLSQKAGWEKYVFNMFSGQNYTQANLTTYTQLNFKCNVMHLKCSILYLRNPELTDPTQQYVKNLQTSLEI